MLLHGKLPFLFSFVLHFLSSFSELFISDSGCSVLCVSVASSLFQSLHSLIALFLPSIHLSVLLPFAPTTLKLQYFHFVTKSNQFINPALFSAPLALFLWPSSSAETTGELLLERTDGSTVKRKRRKDRFFLLKPPTLEREKKKKRSVTAQEEITFWSLIIQ